MSALLSTGLTEKQTARHMSTKSVMLTRIDAVQNMGGLKLLYLLDVPSKIELVDGCVVN